MFLAESPEASKESDGPEEGEARYMPQRRDPAKPLRVTPPV
jgi:hypothetical protein